MKTIIVLAAMILAGCAAGGWNKPGASEQDFRVSRYECERDSRQSNYGQINLGMFARCMQAHGWDWQQNNSPNPQCVSGCMGSGGTRSFCETDCQANGG